jgi:hypothetical protein
MGLPFGRPGQPGGDRVGGGGRPNGSGRKLVKNNNENRKKLTAAIFGFH